MWRVLGWLLVFGLVALAADWYGSRYPQLKFNQPTDFIQHPFDTRVRYRIGTVDTRFGVDDETVRRLTAEAAQIWQDGTGKEWFVYDDNARLTINLIYDERQANTQKRLQLRTQVDDMVTAQEAHSAVLSRERSQLDADFIALQNQVNAWQANHNRIHAMIAQASSPDAYQRLQLAMQDNLAAKRQLDERIAQYRVQETEHNQAVDVYNQNHSAINRTIDDANSTITGEPFHKGMFNGRRIDIYEFESLDDLRLTLAHELGHALDIEHHDEPTALMYPMMGKQALTDFKLQPADVALLNEGRAQ